MADFIGVDIGGTKLQTVLFRNGKIIARKRRIFSSRDLEKKNMLRAVEADIRLLAKETSPGRLKGIGFGVPSPLDRKRQRVLAPPNIPALKNFAFVPHMQRRFRIPIRLENDANCFTLAEALYGAAKGERIVAGVTIGTGLGGGIVIDKKVFTGAHGGAGEFGHMIISEGRELEVFVSKKGIARLSRKDPLDIQNKALAGDRRSKEIYRQLGEYLGIGLANVVNIFDPNVIVIGGGLSWARELLFKQARISMRSYILSPEAKRISIKHTKLGRDAAAIGAASLFLP